MLSGQLPVDLSVSGGVHTGLDLAKSLMAGANSIQMVSGLLLNGPQKIGQALKELTDWMEEKEYESLEELRGCLNYQRCPDPEALERANYMRVLKSFRTISSATSAQ
jgi:dihydroorotate dehydrogenase (fumarate)